MKRITSAENERLKAFSRLCRDRKAREEADSCVIDGAKLCADAAASGIRIKELWLTGEAEQRYPEVMEGLAGSCGEIYVLDGRAAARLSELKAPQGVFAVIDAPRTKRTEELSGCSRILGLCSLQSPENAAAAVRTAAALGYGAVMITSDCADIFSPRSIRAGAGAQLSLDICVTDDMASAVRELNAMGFTTLASALAPDAVPVHRIVEREKLFIAVGNEGHGLPRDVIEACSGTVIIPMSGKVESLNANAAASILMWELRER